MFRDPTIITRVGYQYTSQGVKEGLGSELWVCLGPGVCALAFRIRFCSAWRL